MTDNRYSVRWCNGHWCVFDSLAYCNVVACGLRKWADEAADALNSSLAELMSVIP